MTSFFVSFLGSLFAFSVFGLAAYTWIRHRLMPSVFKDPSFLAGARAGFLAQPQPSCTCGLGNDVERPDRHMPTCARRISIEAAFVQGASPEEIARALAEAAEVSPPPPGPDDELPPCSCGSPDRHHTWCTQLVAVAMSAADAEVDAAMPQGPGLTLLVALLHESVGIARVLAAEGMVVFTDAQTIENLCVVFGRLEAISSLATDCQRAIVEPPHQAT